MSLKRNFKILWHFLVYADTFMEKPSDGLHEKQKHGRRYGRRYTCLVFGSGWMAFGCIDPNNKKNSDTKTNFP